jgi:hypothetical protein
MLVITSEARKNNLQNKSPTQLLDSARNCGTSALICLNLIASGTDAAVHEKFER